MKKRLLSLALCLALCLGLFPFGALATDGSRVYEGTGDPEAASVISVNGTTTNYATLPAALNAAQDGDTVKLLANHTTKWSNVEAGDEQMAVVKKRITLDLNGNTVDYLVVGEVVPDEAGGIVDSYDGNLTVKRSLSGGTAMDGQITTLKFVKGTLSVQDGVIIGSSSSSTGLICEANSGTVTISGGMVYNATVGTGAAVTVSGGSMHQGEWVNNGTLNITGGTFGSVKFNNNSGTIAISGGTFSTLQNFDNTSDWPIAPMSLLAPGHAFYDTYNENIVKDGSSRGYLQNVTVKEHTHTMVNNKCKCACGASLVASITTSGGESTIYASLDDALDAAENGDTVTLLSDAEITKWHSLSKAFTLELNGKTATTQSKAEPKAELYLHARVTVQDSSTGKTGGMAGTALLNVQSNGDLIIKSGTFNGRIAMNDGKLTIKGGTFNQEVDLPRGDSDSVFFSGGTFAKIWYPNSSGSFLDLLADGYAFYDNDGKLVNIAEITGRYLYNVHIGTHAHSFTDGACACGYTCPHTSVDANGACTVCGKQFAASITEDNDVTYYDTFGSALVYATQNNGCTLKLLADVTGTTVQINNPFIFDLNGHSVDALSVDAKATIKDSGTTKGRIGKVTVSDTKVPDLTLGDLLEEGYAFKYGNDYWANDSYLQTTEGSFVTVEKAPIQSVNVYAKDKNNQEILTIAYGATGEVTLVSSCKLSETSGADLTYLWYKLEGAAATAPLEGATGANYTLPDNLAAGTHTYLLICTSDGYSKSKEITITVTPVSLENAEVTVQSPTYNGKLQEPKVTVKLGDKTLSRDNDYTMEVAKQTDAGSYQLTINGGGNYTGTKTVEWKILPKTIANPTIEVGSGGIYDKTAKTPSVVVKDDGTSIPDSEYTVSYENNTNAGTATVKITDKENGNYTVNCSSTFEIQKAPALILETINVTATAGVAKTITVPLTGLMPEDANISGYVTGTMNGFGLVSGDNVKPHFIYDVTENSKEGTITATVTIKSQNYEDSTATVSLTLTPKAIPVGAPTLSKSVLTYGDKLGDITLSGSMMDGEAAVEGTFSWASPEDKPSTTEKYVAKWVFTPKDKNTYATVHGETNITVNKATPTGKPEYTAITTSGKKLSDASLTQTETSFSVPGTVAWKLPADTEVTANTAYEWVFTPNDTDNYNTLTGTITLWHKSSSSSSSGAVTPGTKTDTVKNPDGSTTKTETKADGSKTETTTASSAGGSTGTTVTKTDSQGNRTTEAEAKLSEKDVKNAQETGEAVQVPVKKIEAAKDSNRAPEIKVELPSGAGKTTVEIPVDNVSSGTVAVIVHEDGTEELVKDSKPTEHGVQLELSGSTTVKIIDNSKTFDDTKDHWSRDEVNFVAARELFNGVGGNQFGVSQPMTRGMVNTVLARLAGVDTTPSQGQAWYEVGTDWAKKNGISDGTNPTAPVTREQLATLLYRYAGSPSVSGTLHAADAASVSDYAEDALLWANQNGIVNGVGSNTIAPKDNAQRAQVAAMLARYLQNQ